jgi:hypothetical protein
MLHASRSPCRRVLALVLLVSVRATSCPCRIALCTGSSGARDRSSPLSPCPQPVHCALARIAPVLALLDRLTPGRSLGALLFLSLHFLWKQKQESSYHPCPLSHTTPHRHIRGGAHLSGVQRATRNAGRRGRGKCARADNTQHTTHNTQHTEVRGLRTEKRGRGAGAIADWPAPGDRLPGADHEPRDAQAAQ